MPWALAPPAGFWLGQQARPTPAIRQLAELVDRAGHSLPAAPALGHPVSSEKGSLHYSHSSPDIWEWAGPYLLSLPQSFGVSQVGKAVYVVETRFEVLQEQGLWRFRPSSGGRSSLHSLPETRRPIAAWLC